MEIPSRYDPLQTEAKWYAHWLEKQYFRSVPDEREPYCIVIPPPNVTGVLHMGHMLNNTIQDVLVRRARMQGKNACWVPGTDHASIATEAKVVSMLKQNGIEKSSLSREKFLEYAWEWKEKHGGIILEQLKKLGASCDWDRTCFTMDDNLYDSVIDVFIDLYEKGLIYRGVRMINWDPRALTAVSDEEVIYREVLSKLYYVRYKVEGTDEWLTIATTRPETILGDTAVCIHPKDERYTHLHGKKLIIPLVNRKVPLIVDDYVDMEFGTGALKITPAHDINDYNLGLKYNLECIDIFDDEGRLNAKAEILIGEERFAAREKITALLQDAGYLVKVEDYDNKIGYSERTDAVIEPRLSQQWFMKMGEMAKPALDVVMEDVVKFFPPKFKNTYRHWMENVRDWCISRQLWWGHRIPAYYLPDNMVIIAKSVEKALEIARQKFPEKNYKQADLRQDEDVLDTWFSSWLWPISVFDGIRNPNNADIKYYYPTNDLITAPEILFFWVARMIMVGLAYRREIPFKHVYLTGIVRDKLGRKMSKSLGNSPDPIKLMDHFGADGVRVGMLLTSPAGNDLPFDESLCEQGRNFSNKIWNALRLMKGWKVDDGLKQPDVNQVSISWLEARMNQTISLLDDHYDKYRISDALMLIYRHIWEDFCSWYLEMIKPAYQQAIDRKTYDSTIFLFGQLMKLLHPFMPFITEEIWHHLSDRKEGEDIIIAEMPEAQKYDKSLLGKFDYFREVVMAIRKLRKEKNIPFREPINLYVKKNNKEETDTAFDGVGAKLCNISETKYIHQNMEGAAGFMVKATEFFIPLDEKIDKEDELQSLQEDLTYTRGFLNSVMKKLGNEKFVNNAPEKVVATERKKQADAEAKIKLLEEQINRLAD